MQYIEGTIMIVYKNHGYIFPIRDTCCIIIKYTYDTVNSYWNSYKKFIFKNVLMELWLLFNILLYKS